LPPSILETYKSLSVTERTSSSSAVVRPIYWNPWVAGSIPMGLKFFLTLFLLYFKHQLLLFLYIYFSSTPPCLHPITPSESFT
jgi:hypothetical protein